MVLEATMICIGNSEWMRNGDAINLICVAKSQHFKCLCRTVRWILLSDAEMKEVLKDHSFVSSILNSLPGFDPNDPSVKDLLEFLQGQCEPQQIQDGDKPENKEEK